MIAANITSPEGTVCGTCNIMLSLSEPIAVLKKSHIVLVGDTEDVEFSISGVGCCWTLQFQFPENVIGRLRVGLNGVVGETIVMSLFGVPVGIESGDLVSLEPAEVLVLYDTCYEISAEWGEPVREYRKITVPILFPTAIDGLTKKHFHADMQDKNVKVLLYDSGDNRTFTLQLHPPRTAKGVIRIGFVRPVKKRNGIETHVNISPIEIEVN